MVSELPPTQTRGSQFTRGVKAILPILLAVAPFGMIYGALARQTGLSAAAAQSMSFIVFAGSSQFVTTQLVSQTIPGLVIVLTIFVVNLRHALYSASVAPYLQHLPARWKAGLAYLLTDEAYAVSILHYEKEGSAGNQHWFLFGAGLGLWTCWQLSTMAGYFTGCGHPRQLVPRFCPAAYLHRAHRAGLKGPGRGGCRPGGRGGGCDCICFTL